MNLSFYISAVGAHQQQESMTVVANNVANVNMHGFKAARSRFSSLMYQTMKSVEKEELRYGTGGVLFTTDTKFDPGTPVHTGLSQDYFIEGDGFFGIVDLNTNEVTFTRNGSFCMSSLERPTGEVDAEGNDIMEHIYYLSDGEGRFVLSTEGSMIEMDNFDEEQPVGIFDYPNYNGMIHKSGARFTSLQKNGALKVGSGKLKRRFLETSNVELAEEITKMIETQRSYTMALKMVTTSDEIESTINGLRG